MKSIVAPSLLSCDFLNIETELKAFENEKDLWFHLDVMDGHFVPNLTFGLPIIKKMPAITSVPLDAHFMVSNPEFHIEDCKDSGIHNLTFHLEATKKGSGQGIDNQRAIELAQLAKTYYPSVGISIKPQTNISDLSDELLKVIDLVLIMSVEPGFGGQSFIEGTWDKLKEIQLRQKELNKSLMIQVDGGVSDKNAQKLREYGANNLVAGSFIFKEGPSQYSRKIQLMR